MPLGLITMPALSDSFNHRLELANVNKQLRGVEVAFEHLSRLVDIRDTIAAVESSEMEIATLQMANIALNYSRKTLNLDNQDTILALESMSVTDGLAASLEGFKDVIRAIWDAIVRTLKYIWDKITYIFRSQKRQVQQEIKTQENNQKDIKEISRNDSLPEVSSERLTDPRVLKALSHMSSEPNDAIILRAISNMKNNSIKTKGLISELDQSVHLFNSEIQHLLSNLSQQGIVAEVSNNLATFFNSHINAYIEHSFDRAIAILPTILESNGINSRDVDHDRIKIMRGFIDGGVVYFLPMHSRANDIYEVLALPKQDSVRVLTEVNYFKRSELNDISKVILELLKTQLELDKFYEATFNDTKATMQDLLRVVNAFFHEPEHIIREFALSESDFNSVVGFIRTNIMMLAKLTDEVNTTYDMCRLSTLFYSYLLDLNIKHYKITV